MFRYLTNFTQRSTRTLQSSSLLSDLYPWSLEVLGRTSRSAEEIWQERDALLEFIRHELEQNLQQGDDEGLEFICEEDIYAVWSTSRLQAFAKLFLFGQSVPTSFIKNELEDFRKVLSILVWINWKNWMSFPEYFLYHEDAKGVLDRKDSALQFQENVFFWKLYGSRLFEMSIHLHPSDADFRFFATGDPKI
jgi:hypothetical protein